MSSAWLESLLSKVNQLNPHRNKIAVAVAAFTVAYYYRRSKLPKKPIAAPTVSKARQRAIESRFTIQSIHAINWQFLRLLVSQINKQYSE